MKPTTAELHLYTTPLSRSHSKRIKAAGGKYSHCRGDCDYRFVDVPWDEADLIGELLDSYGGYRHTTVIARGGDVKNSWPAWVVVSRVPKGGTAEDLYRLFQRQVEQADARGIHLDTST